MFPNFSVLAEASHITLKNLPLQWYWLVLRAYNCFVHTSSTQLLIYQYKKWLWNTSVRILIQRAETHWLLLLLLAKIFECPVPTQINWHLNSQGIWLSQFSFPVNLSGNSMNFDTEKFSMFKCSYTGCKCFI